eukprot:scaffold1379_cov390-Prasinococcus_capsulatus_cf.AAC.6
MDRCLSAATRQTSVRGSFDPSPIVGNLSVKYMNLRPIIDKPNRLTILTKDLPSKDRHPRLRNGRLGGGF